MQLYNAITTLSDNLATSQTLLETLQAQFSQEALKELVSQTTSSELQKSFEAFSQSEELKSMLTQMLEADISKQEIISYTQEKLTQSLSERINTDAIAQKIYANISQNAIINKVLQNCAKSLESKLAEQIPTLFDSAYQAQAKDIDTLIQEHITQSTIEALKTLLPLESLISQTLTNKEFQAYCKEQIQLLAIDKLNTQLDKQTLNTHITQNLKPLFDELVRNNLDLKEILDFRFEAMCNLAAQSIAKDLHYIAQTLDFYAQAKIEATKAEYYKEYLTNNPPLENGIIHKIYKAI